MDGEQDWIELTARYNGGYVVLSYLVSFVGAWTTLEILLKRTGSTGLWNVLLLLGAGIAFGSTATFGMHFVGNQAVTLRFPPPYEGTGAPLNYNAGFTILSLIVSCISMIIAFSFIGLRFNAPRWRSPLNDEERGSTTSGEKSAAVVPEDGNAAMAGGADQKDAHGMTGAAFDPDLKVVPVSSLPREEQHTLSGVSHNGERKHSLAPSAFNVALGKDNGNDALERREPATNDEEDDTTVDDGEFGIGAAKVSLWGVSKILLAGIVCGGGIAAMHYIGQVSINSVPRVTNSWYTVFLSVIIAMFCVSVGLYILFVIFRPKLQHSWYKRVLVAGILAVGVTLMHFVALLGTHYWAIEGQELGTGSDKGTKAVIIAIICVVAPLCCILLLVFAYLGQQRALHQKAARHRIMLSTAIFDQHGLLLVHPESGLLPSAKIYPTHSNEQEKYSIWQMLTSGNRLRLDANKVKLQRSDPAFVAFLKMSWNWRTQRTPQSAALEVAGGDEARSSFAGLHAGAGTASRGDEDVEGDRLSEADDEIMGSEAEALRRSVLSFEMAGEEIASELTGTTNLKALGVLHDGILKIGHYQVSSKSSGDQFTVSQGQMLFLARRLRNHGERDALVARGYVFAEPNAVARVMSSAYAVPNERVLDYFRSLYRFTRSGITKRLDRGRLYGGLLMLQALPGEGLQVIVDERQHHSLPMIDLASLVDPRQDQARYSGSNLPVMTIDSVVNALQELGGQTLLDLIKTTDAPIAQGTAADLRRLLVHTLRPYLERVLTSTTFDPLLPRLHVAPTLIPLTGRTGPTYGSDGLIKDSYLICLKTVIPSSVTFPGSRLNWLPFPLYQAQSECVTRSSGAAATTGRPNTGGGSAAAGARTGGSGRSEGSGGDGGVRMGSATDWSTDQGDHPLFAASTAAPFSNAPSSSQSPIRTRGPVQATGTHGSATSTASATGEDDGESETGPIASTSRPPTGIAPDLPPGVPEYSPDWIVGLLRTTVAPGRNAYRWDVPPPARKGGAGPRKGP